MYNEDRVCLAGQFVRQYGYKWEKEKDPNYLNCVREIVAETDNNVFYYTTVSTFRKFAENGCLWASHIRRLNDWQEFELGRTIILGALTDFYNNSGKSVHNETRNYLKEVITEAKRTMLPYRTLPRFGYGREYTDYWNSEVYNLSFTTNEDLLSQWKMYARESGVAIEFDFSRASDFWQKALHGNQERMDFLQKNRIPRRINYDNDQLKKQLKDSIEQIDQDIDQAVWRIICLLEQIPFFKHPGFSQEGESRLIFRPYKKIDGCKLTSSKVGYREWGHVLVPYLEIYCGKSKGDVGDLSECIGWPVVSVTVGPGNDQDVVFESLIHRLEYGNTKFLAFSNEEKHQAREKYFHGFSTRCIEKLHTSEEVIREWWDTYPNYLSFRRWDQELLSDECRGSGDNQNKQLQREYESYCASHYLCSSGIIIKKSKIPYIF